MRLRKSDRHLAGGVVRPFAAFCLLTLKSDADTFVPQICVECYMTWKAQLTKKLFGSELDNTLPKWSETTELSLSDQSQVPYPVLVPDLTDTAKRSTLYSALLKAETSGGGMVKCGATGSCGRLTALRSINTICRFVVRLPQ